MKTNKIIKYLSFMITFNGCVIFVIGLWNILFGVNIESYFIICVYGVLSVGMGFFGLINVRGVN